MDIRAASGRLWVVLGLALVFLAGPAWAVDRTLTVQNGAGSGLYAPASQVHIQANPYAGGDPLQSSDESLDTAAPGQIFDRWTGDTAYVADVYAAHTTVTMPDADIILVPTYRDVDRWQTGRVIHDIPPGHRGVIFMFHGNGGCAACFFEATADREFIRTAVAEGYGVVAINSYDRFDRAWNEGRTVADNIDLRRVKIVHDSLIAEGVMAATDPIYVLGVSNGGLFASLFTEANQADLGFQVRAIAEMISSGHTDVEQTSSVPTIFILGENDVGSQGPSPNNAALQAFNNFIARGVPTQYWMNPPSPLQPQSFWKIEGIDAGHSQELFNAIKNAGLLDDRGYQLTTPVFSNWQSAIPPGYTDFMHAIEDVLYDAYAEHRFIADYQHKILDFFANPTTLLPYVPVVSGFSPASGKQGDTITINGDNFIAVSDVRFNGVSAASFTTRSETELVAIVPAGATTGPITVVTPSGTASSSQPFTIDMAAISGFTPASGAVGATVTVTGTGFVNVTDVKFNGVSVTAILGVTAGSVTVQVPPRATTGPVTVVGANGTVVSPTSFTVLPPDITMMYSTSAPVGGTISIGGVGFSGYTSVMLGSLNITSGVTYATNTQLKITVPAGAVSGRVTVTTPSGSDSSDQDFIVVVAPAITSFSPTSGPVGTVVTINGSGFAGVTRVTLAGTSMSFTVNSNSRITATVPAGAASGKIRVVNAAGSATSGGNFAVK